MTFFLVDACSSFLLVRFGSIIVGAFKSKLSSKRESHGEPKNSVKKTALRGSFSFRGGMQVLLKPFSAMSKAYDLHVT